MVRSPSRLIALDVLRGVAVMGILLMNIVGFAMPTAAYLNPAAYGGAAGGDLAAWAVAFVLVDGKMRALFSLLFGASMLLVIGRAEAAGEDSIRIHFRRMAWLLAIGLVHAYLIWAGDILVPYALVGMLAYAFVERSTRAQVTIAGVLLLGQWLLLAMLVDDVTATYAAAVQPGATPDAIRAWAAIDDRAGIPGADAIARELALYRGGYAAIVGDRIGNHWPTPLLQLIEVGAETLALMLLGMAGVRSGFLAAAWSRAAYARVAAGAYLLGLPALAMIAARTVGAGFEPLATIRAAELYAAPFRPIVMIGHAALVLLWLKRARGGRIAARVAAVGRAAFSNYLGTSLAMTGLFYGYGLGLFGHAGRAELFLYVAAAWAVMLAWSKPWLDRFRYGPLEWLWRSLARGSAQPMRRDTNTIANKSQ